MDSLALTYIEYGVAFLPYHIRFWQNARRFYDSNFQNTLSLFSAFKTLTSMLVIVFNLIAFHQPAGSGARTAWGWVWGVSAVTSSLFNTAWDTRVDWGLFDAKSPRYPLRQTGGRGEMVGPSLS